jgi:hypothetical protein
MEGSHGRLMAVEGLREWLLRMRGSDEQGWAARELGPPNHQGELPDLALPLAELREVVRDLSAAAGARGELFAARQNDRLSAGSRQEQGDDSISWDGPEWDNLAPLTRRLLQYMNGQKQANIADVVENVWGKDYARLSDSAIHVALHKANNFLAKQKHPQTLSKVRGEPTIRWI